MTVASKLTVESDRFKKLTTVSQSRAQSNAKLFPGGEWQLLAVVKGTEASFTITLRVSGDGAMAFQQAYTLSGQELMLRRVDAEVSGRRVIEHYGIDLPRQWLNDALADQKETVPLQVEVSGTRGRGIILLDESVVEALLYKVDRLTNPAPRREATKDQREAAIAARGFLSEKQKSLAEQGYGREPSPDEVAASVRKVRTAVEEKWKDLRVRFSVGTPSQHSEADFAERKWVHGWKILVDYKVEMLQGHFDGKVTLILRGDEVVMRDEGLF